ncbi:MAG: hypothetical protein P4L41_06765 [Flavipsychrobacter sp.]|nr:hypothetical protein [Flavipsychrobacter sp.]
MKRILILITIIGFTTGCYYDKAQNLYPSTGNDSCVLTNVTYSAVVQPIIAQNCAIGGCHDATSSNGFFLYDYAHVKTQATNGQLMGTITHASNYPAMPLSGSLTTCQILQITAWVNAGAQNN